MIFNILDNTTELWMTKYIIGDIFISGGATLYKNPSDQTVHSTHAHAHHYLLYITKALGCEHQSFPNYQSASQSQPKKAPSKKQKQGILLKLPTKNKTSTYT